MAAILNEEPPELAGEGKKISPAVERVVRHCLEKNAADRFQSARDLAFDLESLSGASTANARAIAGAQPGRRPRSRLFFATVGMAGLIVAGIVGYLFGRGAAVSVPTYHQLTFDRGLIYSARFAVDGPSVYYSAAWNGQPVQLYSTNPSGPESRPLNFTRSALFDVSSSEMAISIGCKDLFVGDCQGALARVPISGGAPRQIAENVDSADWTADGTEMAAQELKKSNSLIGTALRLLTEDPSNQEALKTSLGTLTRVLDVVNWHTITKDDPKEWLYFYEQFLEVYDNALRKRTGSYYTPPEVVSAMVKLVDECLRGPLFERAAGFAAADVIVADPAVGTGTFLLGVLRRIAATVKDDQGEGAVRGAIEAAAKRIVGFEMQFGPFAVAQLRLIAEMQTLMGKPPLPDLRLFITDTLGNPFVEEERLGRTYEPIAVSRRAANKVKKEERITVVIGNPPYKNQAAGLGGWIEGGSKGRDAPLDRWTPPVDWGVGAHTHHLKNLYVYFWRWATLKVSAPVGTSRPGSQMRTATGSSVS